MNEHDINSQLAFVGKGCWIIERLKGAQRNIEFALEGERRGMSVPGLCWLADGRGHHSYYIPLFGWLLYLRFALLPVLETLDREFKARLAGPNIQSTDLQNAAAVDAVLKEASALASYEHFNDMEGFFEHAFYTTAGQAAKAAGIACFA